MADKKVTARRPARPHQGTEERELPPPARALLPGALRPALAPTAVAGALVALVLGVMYAGHSRPGRVDRWLADPTADAIRPPWRRLALAVDFLGEPAGAVLLIAAAVAGCLWLRRPRAAVLAVAGPGLAVLTTTLAKSLVGRTIHGEDNLSYPSGHTAFLSAFAFVVALVVAGRARWRRTGALLLVLAATLVAGVVMGWAQVMLSAHYPTDVLGGWCTALAVVPATAWLVDRAAGRGPDSARPDHG
ncbi:phosphatase PAP2 family protein [Streptomyces sp. NPDC006552]|uniref:phosphatase PAP2 family protein n=1 Tax=Streptomyces sp. NPDC006552 TaxID=3157179 RepID=UPI0033A2CBC4